MSMEQLVKALREQYRSYGYTPYGMSKFEEYELYLQNKDFLISERVLTFTDTDGKLMALKPDVTLSIIKNTPENASGVQKVYYLENVYRPGKNDQGFREIMQVGLECMGNVDDYCIYEVLLLAIKSLEMISESCVLDISHMGLVNKALNDAGLSGTARQQVVEAISNKNTHEIRSICETNGVCSDKLVALSQLSGKIDTIMPALTKMFDQAPELLQLQQLLTALEVAGNNCINVDFSVVNDMNYYNGIVFRGFVEGVPEGVLSGGQYDGLMAKMKRSGKAIGFAIYPDLLERMLLQQEEVADAVIYYGTQTPIYAIAAAVAKLTNQGMRVMAQPEDNPVRCEKSYRINENKEVIPCENNA